MHRPPRVVVARARRAEVEERGSCAADTRRRQHTEGHVRVEVEGRRGRWSHNTPAPRVACCMHWTGVVRTAMSVGGSSGTECRGRHTREEPARACTASLSSTLGPHNLAWRHSLRPQVIDMHRRTLHTSCKLARAALAPTRASLTPLARTGAARTAAVGGSQSSHVDVRWDEAGFSGFAMRGLSGGPPPPPEDGPDSHDDFKPVSHVEATPDVKSYIDKCLSEHKVGLGLLDGLACRCNCPASPLGASAPNGSQADSRLYIDKCRWSTHGRVTYWDA
jgi:hypothetical protein